MRQTLSKTMEGNIPAKQKARYHIAEAAVPHLMEMLRNQYNDPVWAVLREFISNALDIHRSKDVNIRTPIDIRLPDMFKDNLIVRDYGPGLSNEDFEELMLGYGETGKEKYVDEKQIGGFGVGGKSFFAIADTAIFNIVHKGLKSQWLCQPNDTEDDTTKLIYSDKPVDEPDGMEVRIPVDTNVYPNMETKLMDIIRYMDYPVRINEKLYDTPLTETLKKYESDQSFPRVRKYKCEELGGWFYLFENAGHRRNEITVIINDIPYPLPIDFFRPSVGETEDRKPGYVMTQFLEKNYLAVEVPDNLFNLAPSREGFIQNKQSAEACNTVYKAITPIIDAEAEKEIKVQETAKKAIKKAIELSQVGLYTNLPYNPEFHQQDSYGRQVRDIPIPFGNGHTSIGKCMALSLEDIQDLEADIYVASLYEYKHQAGPKKKSVLVPLKPVTLEGTLIHDVYAGEISGMAHFRDIGVVGPLIGFSGFNRNNTPMHPGHSYASSPDSTVIFPYPVEVRWVPSNKKVQNVTSRYLYSQYYSYKTYKTSGGGSWHGGSWSWHGGRQNRGWDIDDCRSDVPLVVIHGTEKQRDAALKLLSKYCTYDMQNINLYLDPAVQASYQRPKKTSTSSGQSVPKQQQVKPACKWFRLKKDPAHYRPYSGRHSDSWEQLDEIPEEKFLYVQLYKFEPSGGPPYISCRTNHDLTECLTFLQGIDGPKPLFDNIYGIREADKNKIPSQAVEFHSYMETRFHKWFDPRKTEKSNFSAYQHALIYNYPLFLYNGKDGASVNELGTVFFDSLLEHGYLSVLHTMFPEQHLVVQLSKDFNRLLKMPKSIRENIRYESYQSDNSLPCTRNMDSVFSNLPLPISCFCHNNNDVDSSIISTKNLEKWFQPYKKKLTALDERYPFLRVILQHLVLQKGSFKTHIRYSKKEVKDVLKYLKAMDTESGRKTV